MNIFIDNTSLHSAGRCLESEALGLIDVKGLLQLGTQLIFCNKIIVSEFEYKPIAERSELLISKFRALGVDPETLQTCSFQSSSYTEACLSAANRFSDEFTYIFPPCHFSDDENLQAAWPDMPAEMADFARTVQTIIAGNCSQEELDRARDSTLVGKAASSVAYMVVNCPALLEQLRQVAKSRQWTKRDTSQLTVALRYYANEGLAGVKKSIYSPAVARAQVVRKSTRLITDLLSPIVSDAATKLSPWPIGVLSIADALLARSKGEPKAVVEEAIRLRDLAKDLRDYLIDKVDKFDPDTFEWNRAVSVEARKLSRALAQVLGIAPGPHLPEAFQVTFGPPFVVSGLTFDRKTFAEWYNLRKVRKHVSILSELSQDLAFKSYDQHTLQKLLRQCRSKRKK